jgi:uncharacterized protein YggE
MKKFVVALLILFVACQPKIVAQVMGNAPQNTPRSAGNSIYSDGKLYRPVDPFQSNNSISLNDSTITVSVKGLANVLPDTYVATFNMVQTAATAEMTDQLMRDRLDKFKAKLLEAGTGATDISTDMISFVPKYDIETENRLFSKTYNEIPAGFEMQKNLSVRYKKSSRLDELVTIAAQSEIYDLVKVDCFVSQMDSFKDSLREKCILEVKNRVKSYEGLNLELDTLKKVVGEDFHITLPDTRYSGYQAFARTSLKPGKKGTLNEAEKPVSQYYRPINYADFDVVMNPVVLEPVIQVSYEINVNYQLMSAGKYYIITPAGESKRLILR